MRIEIRRKLEQVRAEIEARKQYEINFNRELVAITHRRQAPKTFRHSAESAVHIKRLLELAAKVKSEVEPSSPTRSTLAPERFGL